MDAQNKTERDPGWYPLQDQFHSVPYHSHIIIGSFMIVIMLLAVGGNAMVIALFLESSKLRTPSNLLVLNLAVADFLMALIAYPLLIVSSFYGRWAYEQWVCDFYSTVLTSFGLMSINTLIFISLDRYVVIAGPHHILSLPSKNVRYSILAIWVYSFMWGIFPLLGWNRYILIGYGTSCSVDFFAREEPHNEFLLCMMIFDFIVPCLIITSIYVLIFCTTKQQGNRFKPIPSNKGQKSSPSWKSSVLIYTSQDQQTKEKHRSKWTQREYKIARTMLVVVVLYVMAWTPFAVITLIGQYGDAELLSPTVCMVSEVFAKVSAVYNPFIYALRHPRFKKQLCNVFRTIHKACVRSKENNFYFSHKKSQSRQSSSKTTSFTATCAEDTEIPDDEATKVTPTSIRETMEQCSGNNGDLQKNLLTKRHKECQQTTYLPQLDHTSPDSSCEDLSTSASISGESLCSIDVEANRMEWIHS